MARETGPSACAEILSANPRQLVARWRDVYRASTLRIPGPCDEAGLSQLVASVLESMAEAGPIGELAPGEQRLRELEKSISFVGSVMAGLGGSGFDVAGLVVAIRDVCVEQCAEEEASALSSLFEWLLVLALDAFATAGVRGERERQREHVEKSTPVVLITPDIPAVFLFGAPDNLVLDGIFGRVLMTLVRVGARSLIIDVSGLEAPCAAPVMVALERFLAQPRVSKSVEVIAVGLGEHDSAAWRELASRAGTRLWVEARFDGALTRALGRTDYRIVRRP